ncbi:SDR family oxidoreductase [Corynebacterium sp. 13CS0277]|uniref:SDR family NAD(P)-dependent oxidoreductase n=1 Tax=Corynebacterium sp. 13CS0277 TaxID=2071994 RepID=UPI000D041F3D|nr:SDR family NAD(P)-dependent oxidoreductase [Corynebacterium sp. 13CS0277]PRQ10374.1 SDR family oxidoreductase [Corynebacterium sp. 13CS0277]
MSTPHPTIPDDARIAVVTGGSSGIGEAAARALAADGWHVIVAARRLDNLQRIADDIGGTALPLDVTDDASVAAFAAAVPRVDVLVNNAGGALGLDSVADANLDDWQWMYDTNVLGTLRVTQALLPALHASGGLVINIGSIAARVPYVGGAGYNAAKHGVAALSRVLRLETADTPLRVCEIDPGRVHTDFSLVRFKGDAAKADAVYANKHNLTAEDIAEAIRWVASLPAHVNIDELRIMPVDQV